MTTGAESDLEQVTSIARQMVGRWGMSDEIGMVSVLPGPDDEPMFFPGTNGGPSEATRELVDREVRQIVDECYGPPSRSLRENRDQLESLAQGAARARDARRGGRVPRRRLRAQAARARRRREPDLDGVAATDATPAEL